MLDQHMAFIKGILGSQIVHTVSFNNFIPVLFIFGSHITLVIMFSQPA